MVHESFTKNDVQLVLNSWKLVRDCQNLGTNIFLKMFEKNPEYHPLFTKFAQVPINDLSKNENFTNHVTLVAKNLDVVIMQLENPEKLKLISLKVGQIHIDKNMEANQFYNCNEAIITVLKNQLKEKFTGEVEAAWKKVLLEVANFIVEGMELPQK